MTCEIAVANRMGIALAADSAVTFSTPDGQQTYASGANKILQLASNQPIAAMIYNNAGLEAMPWELLLKEYRGQLKDGGLRTVFEYKDDLLTFLNGDLALLPTKLRQQGAMPSYYLGIGELLAYAQEIEPILKKSDTDLDTLQSAWVNATETIYSQIQSLEVNRCLEPAEVQPETKNAIVTSGDSVRAHIHTELPHLAEVIQTDSLISWAVEAVFKNWRNVAMGNDYTGVVIAGYGQDEFLPSYCSVRVYGFVGTKLLWSDDGCNAIDHGSRSSFIQPFAQRAMVETFTQGASPEVWKTVQSSYLRHAAAACRKAVEIAQQTVSAEIIEKAINESLDDFTKGWAFATFNAHLRPLQSVVAGLSIPELAELAETLVMLESLKEKVTSRTQSVGGPIDVAIITRSEGLVWIKRKLFFEPQLNQRYLLRLQHQHGGRYGNA